MRNNYVFFWSSERYYQIAFSDILDLNNVKYIPGLLPNSSKLIRLLHIIHHSSAINNAINLPLRKAWREHYFVNAFCDRNPIVFIFHGSQYWMKSIDYFSYLKDRFPNSKCVLLLMDTVDSYRKYFFNKYFGEFDDIYIKKNFDIVLTYNMLDAQRYDYIYYPSIYSMPLGGIPVNESNPKNDVFFIGRAKDRLDLIHNAFVKIKNCGLICDFYIIDVPDQQKMYKEIKYNMPLTYDQVLAHVRNSKGILELVQGGSMGFTFRLDEALVYDRNLITNNTIVETTKYKDSRKIYRYSDDIIIDKEEYTKSFNESYQYNNEYSPLQLLEYFEGVF